MPVLRKAVEELPGKISLPSAKVLAEPRVEILKLLVAAITSEAGELLY